MSVIAPVFCLADRHRPLRRRVEWDGQAYVTTCRHCGSHIHRIAHDKWRKDRD
jgi:hypothetical protein